MKSFGHFFFPTPEMGVNWEKLGEKVGYTRKIPKIPRPVLSFPTWLLFHCHFHVLHLIKPHVFFILGKNSPPPPPPPHHPKL